MRDYVEGSLTLDKQPAFGGATQDGTDDHPSLGDSINRVVGAAKETVDAELSLVRVRASHIGTSAKWIAIFAVVAIITAFGMIVTLMIGAVLALAPLWGLGLALLAVTGAALLVVILCGLGVSAQISRLKRVFP